MRLLTLIVCFVLVTVGVGCSENLPTTVDSAVTGLDVSAKSDNAAVNYTKPYLIGIGENWCAVWGSDDEIYFDWQATAVHNMQTKTGNEVFSCTMKGVFNDTGEVLYFDGNNMPPGWRDDTDPATYMSATFFGLTANWWARVTPSGKALIKAHVNPSDDDHMTYEEYCVICPDCSAWGFFCSD